MPLSLQKWAAWDSRSKSESLPTFGMAWSASLNERRLGGVPNSDSREMFRYFPSMEPLCELTRCFIFRAIFTSCSLVERAGHFFHTSLHPIYLMPDVAGFAQ